MPSKRKILETLSKNNLLKISKTFAIQGVSHKPKDDLVTEIMGHRNIKPEHFLTHLDLASLKEICSEYGLKKSGKKDDLIAMILGRDAPKDGVEFFDPTPENKSNIEQYQHTDKERANNPQIGLVTPKTDPDSGAKKKYQYDPHLDPQLQWAGKAEHTSFEVPTVSLHVHERIDPKTIIENVRKKEEEGPVMSLWGDHEAPLREAIDFYKHKEGWSNRLIAGDSLLVMNSLLEKEGMAGKVQMVYFDPPYGIKYGSNFQPFVNKRDVKDGKDEDLSAEPEMIKAFRDTWELGIHSYLTYLRDRLLLAREILHESGSIFVQISDENIHHVREILDEVFGVENFVSLITFRKTNKALGAKLLGRVTDYILWYAKDKDVVKYNRLHLYKNPINNPSSFKWVEIENDKRRSIPEDIDKYLNNDFNGKFFTPIPLASSGFTESCTYTFNFIGKDFSTKTGKSWVTTKEGMDNLIRQDRLFIMGNTPFWVQYLDELVTISLDNVWDDTRGELAKTFAVQTTGEVIKRCCLSSTDPGDLVLDITCGSGTTAYVAEQWGRRWITCDTSRVALALAKQRLMTANFDYYKLAYPEQGVGSGFEYKTVPHITLKSIANNEPPATETLYDQPLADGKKSRITGPFTVEAVPAPYAKSMDEIEQEGAAGTEAARSGETLRQSEWRDALLRSGVRGKGGAMLHFSRVEPLGGTRFIQAEAETKGETPQRVLVVFGPEHAPLEQRTVEEAWQEARGLSPDILLFCAFQFDDEAAKDIDELKPEVAGMQLLKAQMNADMLTDDLRKGQSSSENFWLVGQPDVKIKKQKGKGKKIQVEVLGFDYYNPVTGNVESGGKKNIAMWLLDTSYDDRSLFPTQVFFPMAGPKDGWGKLAKNLKAEIDEEKIEAFRGTLSLPFEPGKKIAVKIIDDRGIESLRVLGVE